MFQSPRTRGMGCDSGPFSASCWKPSPRSFNPLEHGAWAATVLALGRCPRSREPEFQSPRTRGMGCDSRPPGGRWRRGFRGGLRGSPSKSLDLSRPNSSRIAKTSMPSGFSTCGDLHAFIELTSHLRDPRRAGAALGRQLAESAGGGGDVKERARRFRDWWHPTGRGSAVSRSAPAGVRRGWGRAPGAPAGPARAGSWTGRRPGTAGRCARRRRWAGSPPGPPA